MEASDPNIRAFRDNIQARIKKETKTKKEALMLAEKLKEINIAFSVKSGKEGKLFGSITSSNICDALKERGFELDRKKILLSEPIRHLGSHDVGIRLYPNVTATITVEINQED